MANQRLAYAVSFTCIVMIPWRDNDAVHNNTCLTRVRRTHTNHFSLSTRNIVWYTHAYHVIATSIQTSSTMAKVTVERPLHKDKALAVSIELCFNCIGCLLIYMSLLGCFSPAFSQMAYRTAMLLHHYNWLHWYNSSCCWATPRTGRRKGNKHQWLLRVVLTACSVCSFYILYIRIVSQAVLGRLCGFDGVTVAAALPPPWLREGSPTHPLCTLVVYYSIRV